MKGSGGNGKERKKGKRKGKGGEKKNTKDIKKQTSITKIFKWVSNC